jgi:hypothetical protein
VDIRGVEDYNGVTLKPGSLLDFGNGSQICWAPHQAFHRVDLHSQLAKLAVAEQPSGMPVKLHLVGNTLGSVVYAQHRIDNDDTRNQRRPYSYIHSVLATA